MGGVSRGGEEVNAEGRRRRGGGKLDMVGIAIATATASAPGKG